MLETDIHDLSDDADYAASQQQGSQSVMRCDSGKRSEPEGAEVIYVKENVSVHPTQYMSERISGRLKLIKQGEILYMSWIPYKGQNSNTRLSEKDRNLYTIRPLPFTDVRSIRRHTPALGWQYVIIVLSSGLAFPPLYFYNGGVRELLATVKQHVVLVRSAEDANVFIVNDFEDPLQKTLSSLELPGAVSVINASSTGVLVGDSTSIENQENDNAYGSASASQISGRQRPRVHDPARDLSIQVLEKFSLVTKFARETTSQLFREGNGDDIFLKHGRRKQNQSLHDHQPKWASNNMQKVTDEFAEQDLPSELQPETNLVAVPADPVEFDKLSLVWGKPRQPPLAVEEWAGFLDSEGRVMDSDALRKRVFYGGVEHTVRKEVWPILLGYYEYNSTYAEREYLCTVKKQEYETIRSQWQVGHSCDNYVAQLVAELQSH